MPSLGVSSLDFDRVVQTMRSFFRRGIQRIARLSDPHTDAFIWRKTCYLAQNSHVKIDSDF